MDDCRWSGSRRYTETCFIDTLGWGVAGAAWATNISMVIYSVLGIWYYAGKRASFSSKFWSWTPDKAIIKETMSLGMPVLL